jgi:type I restriction enzyme S subunit
MSFPRYPNYKNSGVEWLGEVPEHWHVDRIKYSTTSCQNGIWGDEAQGDENDIPCVRVADFDRQGLRVELSEPTIRSVTKTERMGRVLSQGDLLLEKSGGGETQPVGCVVLYDDPCPAVCSNFVARVKIARNMSSSFWRYVHAGAYAVRLNTKSIKQTSGIQNLDSSQYFDERAGFPPLSEQILVAAFLDRETAKIDALVAEQQRLIELLKEKRQAVISHAVTKGLAPNAPMKSSGVEWLGDVPKHWEINRIASLFREVTESGTNELPILSVSIHHGVSDEEIAEENLDRKVTRSDDRSKYKRVAPDDLVYNMMRAWQGGFGTVTVAGMVSPAYVVARPRKPLKTAYIEHLLRTPQAIEQVRRHSRGITDFRLRLYWEEFKNLRVALPPQKEAIAICAKIADMEERFDAMSAACEDSIELLQERRTSLISDAVTGKIDVRGLAHAKAEAA